MSSARTTTSRKSSGDLPQPRSSAAPDYGENMRFIYTDETGTSANSETTIVVGIMLEPDSQYVPVQAALMEAVGHIPEQYRKNWVPHAKDLADASRYDDWDPEGRLQILRNMMAIPGRAGLQIAWAAVRRSMDFPIDIASDPNVTLTKAEKDHLLAFQLCIAAAEIHMRECAPPREMISVVAAQTDNKKDELLQRAIRSARMYPYKAPFTYFQPDPITGEIRSQIVQQEVKIERMVDQVHFVTKFGSRILPVADCVAYGLRRFLSRADENKDRNYAAEYAKVIFGHDNTKEFLDNCSASSASFGCIHYPRGTAT
jgi:hypothetical protein